MAIRLQEVGKRFCGDPQGLMWPCVRVGDFVSVSPGNGPNMWCTAFRLDAETTPWSDAAGGPVGTRTYMELDGPVGCVKVEPPWDGRSDPNNWSVDDVSYFMSTINPLIRQEYEQLCARVRGCDAPHD